MNTFALIEQLPEFSFDVVKYYTIRLYDEDVDEFRDFLNRHEDLEAYKDDLNNLVEWLVCIGNNEGAKEKYFRNESYNSEASALPPPRHIMKAHRLQVEDIRLYCLRLNEYVVFLFNGGIKTEQYAQNCPNVAKYFKRANLLAKSIDQLIREHEIVWNTDRTDIEFNAGLRIEL